jgi:hypothetical protein
MERFNQILAEALRLQSMGLSVIPIRQNKKPALRWKKYQTSTADEQQVRYRFDGRDDLGLAVVLGRASNDLAVRDFDTDRAFRRWADSFPSLDKTLPIAKTRRGFHVYARILNCATKEFDDGELRANGSYAIVPPSTHASGTKYRWLKPLDSLAAVPTITIEESGFGQKSLSRKTRETTDTTESISVLSVASVQGLDRLIEATLPPCFGTRRRRLFLLARRVRIDPQFAGMPLAELKPVLKEWHRRALPTIRTKPFDESWADFVTAHGNVDLARCGDVVQAAMTRADEMEPPRQASQYDSPLVKRLIALCCELSRLSPDGVFFLSCRTATKAIGATDHTVVARMLRMLCADGVLIVVEPGGPQSNRATRYRYLFNGAD